ncbi:MAG: uroporphyrinogen-III synthase [Hylemonella sp.]|jgi:uroporphyrinogen-III synthase|uniref:uroporphyrinogen-III synthase n=1 Tax=Hylemonella sp. TaxID=2066020 RepID=UPI00391B2367
MRVVVTRPQREAQDWVQALQQAGHEAWALPLIAIAPAPDAVALRQAWAQLDRYLGVMFVSANAVEGFHAARPAGDATSFEAWATGPGTVRALRQAGVPQARIVAPLDDAPQFDSEALWALVAQRIRPGVRVLVMRGADAAGRSSEGAGRDWFGRQVREAGGEVEFLASYQRQPPVLDAAQRQRALAAACDGSVWLFSSSEAVHNLQASLPDVDWRHARAVATHARIAQAARAAGFAEVRDTRPALADVQASIESFQ